MKRRKKRASNKTEEAILLREQTRRGRGEGSAKRKEREGISKDEKDAKVYGGGKERCASDTVVVDIMREE